MIPETMLDKILHFIYHRRYFISNINQEQFSPRWQNVYFGIPSEFVWFFQEEGHFLDQVSFKTEREARAFLMRPDVDSLRHDIPSKQRMQRIR